MGYGKPERMWSSATSLFGAGIEDRVKAASGGWLRLAFIGQWCAHTGDSSKNTIAGDYDIMVVGYPGQFDVFLAGVCLTWLRHKLLVWDVFMSIYLITLDRGLDKRSPLTISVLRFLEQVACRIPDRLILDTSEYAAWFERFHSVPLQRFYLVPTGADDRLFHPQAMPISHSPFFNVIYFGTFIRNHGVDYIVEAARILNDDPSIRFTFIGDGAEREKVIELARQYDLKNVIIVKWMEKTELAQKAAQADVILGAFGSPDP